VSALTTSKLVEQFRKGDRRACARLLSLVENEAESSAAILDELYPLMGGAYRIGITGPPGAGKSTLVEKLALELRKAVTRVGIVAVDPTSPFSGGAILGDRVRMPSLFLDEGVFIRSMATRGGSGGLALRTKEVCDLLDAFGCEHVIIETVGVGQVELDIASAAHTTVVVLVPESGDSIQVMKAGLMEIGDVFCVNKSDRTGADRLAVAICSVLEQRRDSDGWIPPVVETVATAGTGVDKLSDALRAHRQFLESGGRLAERRRNAIRAEVVELVEEQLRQNVWQRPEVAGRLAAGVDATVAGKSTPYRTAHEILALLRD